MAVVRPKRPEPKLCLGGRWRRPQQLGLAACDLSPPCKAVHAPAVDSIERPDNLGPGDGQGSGQPINAGKADVRLAALDRRNHPPADPRHLGQRALTQPAVIAQPAQVFANIGKNVGPILFGALTVQYIAHTKILSRGRYDSGVARYDQPGKFWYARLHPVFGHYDGIRLVSFDSGDSQSGNRGIGNGTRHDRRGARRGAASDQGAAVAGLYRPQSRSRIIGTARFVESAVQNQRPCAICGADHAGFAGRRQRHAPVFAVRA